MDGERYARMPKGGLYFDIIRHPLEDAETAEDLRLVHPAVRMSEEDVYKRQPIEDLQFIFICYRMGPDFCLDQFSGIGIVHCCRIYLYFGNLLRGINLVDQFQNIPVGVLILSLIHIWPGGHRVGLSLWGAVAGGAEDISAGKSGLHAGIYEGTVAADSDYPAGRDLSGLDGFSRAGHGG